MEKATQEKDNGLTQIKHLKSTYRHNAQVINIWESKPHNQNHIKAKKKSRMQQIKERRVVSQPLGQHNDTTLE